jgi:hypothetical protein
MMNKVAIDHPKVPALSLWLTLLTLMLTLITSPVSNAWAQDDSAGNILKVMADYVASQNSISATLDTDIEIITPEVQKIQFTRSGKLMLSRPDKLRATRTGGYADVDHPVAPRYLGRDFCA